MLRKTILLSLVLSSFTAAYASYPHTGFYVGAGAGPDFVDFDQSATIVRPLTFNVQDNTHLAGIGVFGTLFAGYGVHCQRYYLAGEANVNFSSAQFNGSNYEFIHNSFSTTEYSMQRYVGLSILPGIFYTNDTLFFARIGYARGNFDITTSDVSLANISRNLNGLRYGVGIKQTLTEHLAARMEYNHINYQTTSFTAVDGLVTKTTHISPQTNQVEFSLIYDFV